MCCGVDVILAFVFITTPYVLTSERTKFCPMISPTDQNIWYVDEFKCCPSSITLIRFYGLPNFTIPNVFNA